MTAPGGQPPVTHHWVDLDHTRLHYARAGHAAGRTVVLVHGWPQTWYEWRLLVPLLDDLDLVMPDLRGLGDSSPATDGFDKRTLAGDLAELITDQLDARDVAVIGHDWGGVVAVHLAHRLRERVTALGVLDVTVPEPPGDGPAMDQGGQRWHHAFHRAPDALAETVITGHEADYYGWFLRNYGATRHVHTEADMAEYLRSYRDPVRMRAGLGLYRTVDADRADGAAIREQPLTVPVLALGGGASFGRRDEPERSLARFATEVHGAVVPDAGHWIPEEAPELLAGEIRDLLHRTDDGGRRS